MNDLIKKDMLLYSDIIKDDHPDLRQKSLPANIPLSNEEINVLKLMNDYLWNSYDNEIVEKYKLRPGVGLAAPQIGILKNVLYSCLRRERDFHNYCIINPKIISHSEEDLSGNRRRLLIC